jgi:hypothetical protein
MLSALQKWALDHETEFKLFNPCSSVRNRLEHVEAMQRDIAPLGEIMSLLSHAETQFTRAA